MALPSAPRCLPKSGSTSINRLRSSTIMPDTSPPCFSKAVTDEQNREKADSVGTPLANPHSFVGKWGKK